MRASSLAAVTTALLAQLLLPGAWADCTSYGVDYSNGGTYYIDGSSNQYFSFITVFQGCAQESVSPVLVDPDGNQYACSAISMTPSGTQETSTCGIPYSAMKSGQWKIIVVGDQIAVQRALTLTVGVPQASTVTITPTVIIGITSTVSARTISQTLTQTETLIIVPKTITTDCQGQTQTVTKYQPTRTQTTTSTVTRTSTEGGKTSTYTTTATVTGSCHYQSKRSVAHVDQVMATTVTVTETTYTVTQTRISTVSASTTTELIFRTVTATITPSPSTSCSGSSRPSSTITVTRGGGNNEVTQTDIVYRTTRVSGTVSVGQTQYTTVSNSASATSCWRAGGWYG